MDTLIVFSNNVEKDISEDDYIYQVYKGKKLYSYTYSYLERALLHKSRVVETDFNYEKHVKLNLENLYVVRSKKDIIPSAFINGTIDIQALQKELDHWRIKTPKFCYFHRLNWKLYLFKEILYLYV